MQLETSADETASEGTAPKPPVIQDPSACPFSGVAIDQTMWESFQAKLATNNHHNSNTMNGRNNIPRALNEDDSTTTEAEKTSPQSLPDSSVPPPLTFLRRSVTTNYRVRVINESTKRSKDMVVDQSGENTLFNAVYNHPSLKEANIRKWGSQIAEELKRGKSEIKVKVTVGSRFGHWFSLEDLKQTTTRQLFEMIEEYQSDGPLEIRLVPVPCVEPNGNNEAKGEENDVKEEEDQGHSEIIKAIPEECTLQSDDASTESFADDQPKALLFSRSVTNTILKVRVMNQLTKRSKDMVVPCKETITLYEGIYNHPSVKDAHIRKWGSDVVKMVKSGQSVIKVEVSKANEEFHRLYCIDELKATTTLQLYKELEKDGVLDMINFQLVALPGDNAKSGPGKVMGGLPQKKTSARVVEETVASKGNASAANGNSKPQSIRAPSSPPSTFRVCVVNQITKRRKDLVVDCTESANLFESIYDNPTVKEAHVRKWGPDTATLVKSDQFEIRMEVSLGHDYTFRKSFSVEELKDTTNMQFYRMIEEYEKLDTITFSLVCESAGNFAFGQEPRKSVVDVSSVPSADESDNDRFPGAPVGSMEEASPGTLSPAGGRPSWRQEALRIPKRGSLDLASMGRNSSASVSNSMNGSSGNNSFVRYNASGAASSHFDSTMSDVDMSVHMMETDALPLAPMSDQAKSTLGVRVINQTTQRHKDLVVTISDKDTVFDMVYDHPGVKSAHVRKWGGPIARAVRNGTSFIRFSVWDDDTGRPWKVFSIDELKTTTTRQLYELVSESTNLVKIYLQCVSAENDSDTAIPTYTSASHMSYSTHDQSTRSFAESVSGHGISDDSNKDCGSVKAGEHKVKAIGLARPASTASLTLGKTGRPQHTMTPRRQASIRLQEQGRLDSSDDSTLVLKRPGRPNHMNWAASQNSMPRNGSCPAIRHMYSSNHGASKRRSGSHDRLSPFMPKATRKPNQLPRVAKSAADFTSGSLSPVTPRLSPPVSSPTVGTKNESSKNAVWQPRKTPVQTGTNKLLDCLKLSKTGGLGVETINELFVPGVRAESKEAKNLQAGKRPVQSKVNKTAFDLIVASKKSVSKEKQSDKIREVESMTESQQDVLAQEEPRRSRQRALRRGVSMSNSPQRMITSPPSSTKDDTSNDLLFIKPHSTLKRTDSDPLSLASGTKRQEKEEAKARKLKEFMRLLRTKRLPEFQSQRSLERERRRNSAMEEISAEAAVPAVIHTGTAPSTVGAVADQQKQSLGMLQETFEIKSPDTVTVGTPDSSRAVPDKISRFLRKSQATLQGETVKTNDKISRFLAVQRSAAEDGSESKRISWNEPDDAVSSVSRKSSQLPAVKESCPSQESDMPPLTEICVVAGDVVDDAPTQISAPAGVALPPELVKEVFPYHIVLDANFRIIQIGNNLEMLVQESGLVGKEVSDIMTITSPIPMFGMWDWSILEKMKDKTIFLETVLSPAVEEKVKLKGTLINLSKTEKQVMLVLFPNVKNLSELEDANLSMADLPLHSCQREAVLLGEHSKSEVNLTNHLDKLHRDLIDSMEQQIKERTEELAAANRSLETANDRLAIQSARQLEHFACMSHEIRTPLNCIVGMSSLLLDDADEMDPMHADSIRMINTSGDLLKAVVDDVLDYAKLESGSFEVDIKERNLQHTLNSVAHSISEKVRDKNVRLRLDFSPCLPKVVETDDRRLQQVLFNLLGNAGKFSKNNSVIDLTVSVVPVTSTDVNPDDTSSGAVIRFAVKDYGKGIEEKDFKSIFEPFSQASKETQNIYGGTGLGLSITTKLVHRLGGTISLKSEFGKYAEFTVDLPLRGPEVDVPKISERLRNTTLVLIDTPRTYDYSFTNYEIKPEPLPFRKEVAEAFNLDVINCESLNNALERVEKAKASEPTKHFAILLHEDLYKTGLCEKLNSLLSRDKYTLMTFGPQYSVELTKDRHFKSLVGFFPSALLESIAEQIEKGRVDNIAENRSKGSSNPLFSTSTSEPTNGLFATATSPAAPTGLFATISSPAPANTGLFPSDGASSHGGALFAADASPSPPTGLFSLQSSNTKPPSAGLFATADGLKESADGGPGSLFSIAPSAGPLASGTGHTPASSVPPTAPKSTEKQNNHSPARQALKVLYAEDNKVNQKVLSRVLARSGVTNVTIVENGKEAVDITETVKFDIIFMDIQMPVMGGMEATSIITERNPSEKVIFVTAHALDEFKAQAEAVGATSFISKPFRLSDIEELFQKLGY